MSEHEWVRRAGNPPYWWCPLCLWISHEDCPPWGPCYPPGELEDPEC